MAGPHRGFSAQLQTNTALTGFELRNMEDRRSVQRSARGWGRAFTSAAAAYKKDVTIEQQTDSAKYLVEKSTGLANLFENRKFNSTSMDFLLQYVACPVVFGTGMPASPSLCWTAESAPLVIWGPLSNHDYNCVQCDAEIAWWQGTRMGLSNIQKRLKP